MTYLEAKIELQEGSRIPFMGMAIEAVALIGVAALLVLLFF